MLMPQGNDCSVKRNKKFEFYFKAQRIVFIPNDNEGLFEYFQSQDLSIEGLKDS